MTFQNRESLFHNQVHSLGLMAEGTSHIYLPVFNYLIIQSCKYFDLPGQEIWGLINLELLNNFHSSSPKTFLLLRIMGRKSKNLSLVLLSPIDNDSSKHPSTQNLAINLLIARERETGIGQMRGRKLLITFWIMMLRLFK